MVPGYLKLSRFMFMVFTTGFVSFSFAAEKSGVETKASTPRPQASLPSRMLEAILPTSMQKRPVIQFNVITEKTPEGRRRGDPSPDKPLYYFSQPGKFRQMGVSVTAGEHPPPVADLEVAMKNALATNGYLPISQPGQKPDILILFNYGSHGTDPAADAPLDDPPPVTAAELVPLVLRDVALFKDVIERATFVGGEKFSMELKAALDEEVRNIKSNQAVARIGSPPMAPVSPEPGSPFDLFARSKSSAVMEHLAEVVFHTCYFVVASAYDFASFESKQPQLLWRTKMTVEAQGVSMQEVLSPLIASAAPYLGREMAEPTVVKKRISREGKVEIGTPTVVEETAPKTEPQPTAGR